MNKHSRNETIYIYGKIKEYLSNLHVYRPTLNGDEVAIRCPFCPDGKSANSAHFYIGFKDDIILYECKKCAASGRFTYNILNKLDIYDKEIEKFLRNKYKFATKKINNIGMIINNYKIPEEYSDKDLDKIFYFENRTGVNINKTNIKKYRVVVNLREFLELNKIDIPNKILVNDLSRRYIGALSYDKNTVSLRQVIRSNTTGSKTHYRYSLNPEIKQGYFYIPETTIDIMTPSPKIILAEGGFFDIICIKNRYYPSDTTDTVFASVGGVSGYKTVLKKILSITGFVNAEVVVYSHDDIPIDTYRNQIFSIYKNLLPIKILYNENGKDFGNINDIIKIKKYKL